ncbi:MAG: WecB/TagA/CpsF family glycosyltransferase [Chthoniobacterales bacterium]
MALRVNILGVGLSVINLSQAVQLILERISKKEKGYICVTGVHGVSEAQKDPAFRRILNGSFLNTPDGMPMSWVGRLQGHKTMSRVYGPDLMMALNAATQNGQVKHFYYGGKDGVAELLRAQMEKGFPGLEVVGTYTPPFRPLNEQEQEELADMVARTKPDIFWVGLSTPKQEKFMAEYLNRLDTCLMIGVGAAFDIHSGMVVQAPKWIQRSGLEWLFRLLIEPKRLWKRYLVNNPLFIGRIALQLSGLRRYPMDNG